VPGPIGSDAPRSADFEKQSPVCPLFRPGKHGCEEGGDLFCNSFAIAGAQQAGRELPLDEKAGEALDQCPSRDCRYFGIDESPIAVPDEVRYRAPKQLGSGKAGLLQLR